MPLEGKGVSLRDKYGFDLLSTPDDEDCMKKILYGSGYGLYAGEDYLFFLKLVNGDFFVLLLVLFKPLCSFEMSY